MKIEITEDKFGMSLVYIIICLTVSICAMCAFASFKEGAYLWSIVFALAGIAGFLELILSIIFVPIRRHDEQ